VVEAHRAEVRPDLPVSPGEDLAVVATDFLRHSLQYRRLLARVPLVAGGYRDRLLDAMASLLVDLHRAGVFWGDCSLANTLLVRDGQTLQVTTAVPVTTWLAKDDLLREIEKVL